MPSHTYTPNDYNLGKPAIARHELTQLAKTAIPGYSGHKPNYMKGKSSPAPSVCSESDTSSVAGWESTGRLGGSSAGRSRSCSGSGGYGSGGGGYLGGAGSHKSMGTRMRNAPPGYGGYVPGKRSGAGDHVGHRFVAANSQAISEFTQKPGEIAEVPLTKDQLHGRVHVPGYSGHMPGFNSDTLCGTSPIKAAREGWLAKNRERELGGGLVAF